MNAEIGRLRTEGNGGEWQRILQELGNCMDPGETATHRVSLLKSANKKPLSVSPDTSIRHAVTLMMESDYSQLPILDDEKTVKGMFSWRSYAKRLAMGHDCKVVDNAIEPALVLDLDAWIFEAFASVSKNDVVLIQNGQREICGIITAYDVSETFGTLVEPFLLIEEIEKHVRKFLNGCVDDDDLKGAITFKGAKNGKPQITDLNFGGYLVLLNKDSVWNRMGLNLEKCVFVAGLSEVKSIRNDVMHFRPTGIGVQKLNKLRTFAKFLREIRHLRKK